MDDRVRTSLESGSCETGANRFGRLLAACRVTRADPDLMIRSHELTRDLKAQALGSLR